MEWQVTVGWVGLAMLAMIPVLMALGLLRCAKYLREADAIRADIHKMFDERSKKWRGE